MKPASRTYQNENDYWRIREFLRGLSMLNDRHDHAWPLLRWDYWVWHVNMNIFQFDLREVVRLWDADGQIVAMVNLDGRGEAFFQIHPAYHDPELISEMLDVADSTLPSQKDDGKKELIAWVNEDDEVMKEILARRGHIRSKYRAEHKRRRLLARPIPDSVSPSGYTVRAQLAFVEGLPS